MDKISLKAARVNANLTQEQLAEKLGVTRQTVRSWEKGYYKPTKRSVMAMCQVLNLKEDDIFLPQ